MFAARISHTHNSADPTNRTHPPIPASTLGRQLTVEFIGTFVLVITVGLASSARGAGDLAPLAIGSALMVMVFAGGHISGAHYNPAVSLAALVAGRIRPRRAAGYVLTQLVAGALAALLARGMVGPASTVAVAADWKVLVAELIFTLALAYVVLNVTAAPASEGNSFYGLAIGFTVTTGGFAVGRISGGAFNLAVALGGGITGALTWSHWWIYVLATVLAGTASAVLFDYLHPALTPDG